MRVKQSSESLESSSLGKGKALSLNHRSWLLFFLRSRFA